MTEGQLAQARGTIKDLLQKSMPAMEKVLPKHLSADRMVRIATVAATRMPELAKCTPMSFVGAMMTASQLGLEPFDARGLAYLIPYGDTAQFIIGYRGLIELARRSGIVSSIEARAVHENDSFDYDLGLNPKLEHKPCTSGDAGKLTYVYAIARQKDGSTPQFDVMPVCEVEAIRTKARGGNSPAWRDYYDEMAKKTIVRRLCKMLPLSVEIQDQLAHEDSVDFDNNAEPIIDMTPRRATEATPVPVEEVVDVATGELTPEEEAQAEEYDSGYYDAEFEENFAKENPPPAPVAKPAGKLINAKQLKIIPAICHKFSIGDEIKAELLKEFGYNSTKEIVASNLDDVIKRFEAHGQQSMIN